MKSFEKMRRGLRGRCTCSPCSRKFKKRSTREDSRTIVKFAPARKMENAQARKSSTALFPETAERSRLPVQLRSALRVVQAQCQTGE